ncbi:hypothetical protein GKE82_19495 [Conexibacter sp. W3-3-2]|uniref:GIY-YIG nuclease family protein n=1 Tax=Conexibacter sp. W3-3-2 TaxID=2675227 RepID=UPI0012B93D9C|nr:GIY-YIG nuclease family protein [Conexibacter sp. W3-3-2]MTD46411.1 hypothetical protein [Conexibacter sp. W3-3-2]
MSAVVEGVEIPVAETVGSPAVARRIYAYTVVGRDETSVSWQRTSGSTTVLGRGLIKVGETTKPTAEERIKQQLGTAFPGLKGVSILLDEPAERTDGTAFRDHDVHRQLQAADYRRDGEWFEATLDEVRAAIVAVRNGKRFDSARTQDFPMRPEQEDAVARTAGYFAAQRAAYPDSVSRFLWNAKMRFGKTFATYQLARELGWNRLLVLTYKPAVQSAWKDDLLGHVDFEGWHFVDRDTDPEVAAKLADSPDPVVWFVSFQDLAGRTADGEVKDRHMPVHWAEWDCIAIDEYHFGAWRDTARDLYDPIDNVLAEQEEPDEAVTTEDLGLKTGHILYLSGTPFRAITNGEFTEDAIFNWTYPDEQEAKETWDVEDGPNPYLDLPRMEMFCYGMSERAAEWAAGGEFDGFSLNEFFKAKRTDETSKSTASGAFVFEDETGVSEFLNMLRGKLSDHIKMQVIAGQKAPFPYEAPVFEDAVRHSVWYMPDVGSCLAMRDLLTGHPAFRDYRITVAAGNQVGMGAEAKPPVDKMIADADRDNAPGSITLSCGKLMTGVTVPQWGAILMLRSLKSPESYFQAAFRVQSPWSTRQADGTRTVLKEKCFVFEFDPNRALSLLAEYGIRLSTLGESSPSEAIGKLINYLPIYGFEGGAMLPLDANDVLNWATAGIGASALARRWNSPLLVNVNEHSISAVLAQPELLETLEQIEDFRALVQGGEQIVTSTKLLKKAKREQGGKLTGAQKKEQSETVKKRKEIREKLQKFLAKIPVFMYVTDVREEALKDIILSADSALFERVTGLTVEDFKLLNELGLFNAQNLNHAVFQFKVFESSSLHYADSEAERPRIERIGLWDQTVTVDHRA